MKVIRCDLGDFEKVEILPLADVHLGDINSDFKKLQGYLSYIRENENVFTILNGDLMDTAIVGSVGDSYSASLNPMEQIRECVKVFEDIAPKVLAVLPGNHERRVYRSTSLDMTEVFCTQLGLTDKYSPASAYLFIRVGAQVYHQKGRPFPYTIYCSHGSGGGRKEGGKVQRLVDLSMICDADIYLMSHTHQPAIVKNSFYRVSGANSSIAKVDHLYVNTGAFLEYGGYGEVQNYRPAAIDMPIIELSGREKRFTARV